MIFNFNKIRTNSAVHKAYIRLATSLCGKNFDFFEEYSFSIRKQKYIVCSDIWQVLVTWFYLIGSKKKIIYWIQGSIAEESYLKHGSLVRFCILKIFERLCLLFSDGYIYVSPYMKDTYSKSIFTKGKPYLVFPCISDLKFTGESKEPNSFCYLGGMSKWQNFPQIVSMMNVICEKKPGSVFRIATNDTEECLKVISEVASNCLRNSISVVSLSSKIEIENFFFFCEFGFLIRDDILVNQVASPIKLAEYLSCGVTVIITPAIRSYASILNQAGIVISSTDDLQKVNLISNFSEAIKMYEKYFSTSALEKSVKIFLEELKLK